MDELMGKIAKLPVGTLATAIGLVTLSNVYFSLGYTWIKYISVFIAAMVWIANLLKLILHFESVKTEYRSALPASLYASFAMLMMILGAFVADYFFELGKIIWLIAIIIHIIFTIIFTYTHVYKGVDQDLFLPTWFVTYDGLLVSTVVGSHMHMPVISKIIVIYGLIMFIIIMPFMLFRVVKRPLAEQVYHTGAILMGPGCLVLISWLNVFENPNPLILYLLYLSVLLSLIYIVYNVPIFFKFSFHPGFAGLTFPMAIGTVATQRFSEYVIGQGQVRLGAVLHQLMGIQLYLTTAIVSFVVYNFFRMLYRSLKRKDTLT